MLDAQAPGRVTATVVGADGRVLAVRSRALPVGGSTLDLPVTGSAVRLATTTSFYRVAAVEQVLAGTAQEQLPLTGGVPLAALGLAVLAGAALLRRA